MKIEKSNVEGIYKPIVYTAAQLKGRRLRMVRALTGFSRQELYEKTGIATSTMDTWESGRVELTEKSAERVCMALRKIGVYCAAEWLLTSSGMTPRNMDEVEKSMFLTDGSELPYDKLISKYSGINIPPFLDEDIRRELSFFINLHERALFHVMEEGFLNARYKRSDCVAGIEENPTTLIDEVIIGQRQDGKTMVGRLLSTSQDSCCVFLGKDKPQESIRLLKTAAIIWHRKSRH
jgi:transcriptional regulator with XRE-family HTH domain